MTLDLGMYSIVAEVNKENIKKVVEYVDSCGIYFTTSVKCNFLCVCLKMCCVLFKDLGQKYYHYEIMYTVCLP